MVRIFESLRASILRSLSLVEALIDFGEEDVVFEACRVGEDVVVV